MTMTATTETLPGQAKTKGGTTVYLQVDGAAQAAKFYERAFGAEITAMHPVDEKGCTMHVHLYVNGTTVMLSDFYPEHGVPKVAPAGFSLTLHVSDIDTWYKRAVDAGASVGQPVTEMFWGDRYGSVKDPYGVTWAMNQAKSA